MKSNKWDTIIIDENNEPNISKSELSLKVNEYMNKKLSKIRKCQY